MCFVYNAIRKMGEYYERNFTDNTTRIRQSDDPYEILRIVFEEHWYADTPEETAAMHLTDLARHDTTRNKALGLLIIHAVLDMMRGTEGWQAKQALGCDIFWRLSVDPTYGTPLYCFVQMKDEIEDAVQNALRMYRICRVGWLGHANKVLHDIKVIRHQAITDTVVTGVHMHTDGVVSKAVAAVKRTVGLAPPPFWLKIDGLISEEDAIIQSAFENTRSISQEELPKIVDIRNQRNSLVFATFMSNLDPRKDSGTRLRGDAGGGSRTKFLDVMRAEIVIRRKYRDEHPSVPGLPVEDPRSPLRRELTIQAENDTLKNLTKYWAKTHYTGSDKFNISNLMADRRKRATGMEIWNALLVHDTLTQSCFERAAGTRIISSSEYDKLHDNVADLKFLVRILAMDVK